MSDPRNTFLSDTEVEQRWQRSKGYLAELRSRGAGPKFTQLSPRVVRYRLDHLLEYEDNRVFESTAAAMVEADGDFPPDAA